ncbi:AAA family ATPase [Frigoribacterium sp. VKM Ac-1396]|uniref:AAA family ATPase n=1 Tax=Frigoribacterium sp. VKM Ac-1396 TaxID=2783821 RepID=UPI00188CA2C9|nr:AAA family ATPase [Frigoribacterium sp. VKM Ac-1396]MBF4600579.1 AAA family ATPase [Frigoribacterium sp. VKM Ac-1396]
MLITSVQIENFRCIEQHTINFENITSFIGPNGAGKSTVLRALDWVFNGAKDSLSVADVFGSPKTTDKTVRVTVNFASLSDRDREVLTERYAPAHAETFAIRREWNPLDGDRLAGASASYPAFSNTRKLLDGPAEPAKAHFRELRTALAEQGIELAAAASKPAIIRAFREWEELHPEDLVPTFTSDNHMFGFAGQGELGKVFSFIFVDADLRAHDEAEDTSKSIVGRLLSRALDRTEAEAALADLADEVTQKHDAINKQHLGPKLGELSEALTAGIGRFTIGRNLVLRPQGSLYAPPKSKVDVKIFDQIVETSLGNQGHGFQRAALVACLQVLAAYSTDTSEDSTLFLAIEEPELFQHPTQARAFASVLRRLAREAENKLQVAYATHSLYFVDPFEFHEVRRVTRTMTGQFSVAATSRDAVSAIVAPQMSAGWEISSQWSKLILLDLREALFSAGVVLCEGADDAAILQGASTHLDDFDVLGVTATAVRGKSDLFLAHAVLEAFQIPTLMVWDNDSDLHTRMATRKQAKLRLAGEARELTSAELDAIEKIKEEQAARFNRKMAAYLDLEGLDAYPVGLVSANAFAVADTLETMLNEDWPALFEARETVIKSGDGVDKEKHEATYWLAAQQCSIAPTGALLDILVAAKALVAPNGADENATSLPA